MKCTYCDNPATYVFKARAPSVKIIELGDGLQTHDPILYCRVKEYCHGVNQWLCEKCAGVEGDPVRLSTHYVPVRFVPAKEDRLPDKWEKEWTYAYKWQGEHIFFHPKFHVYWIDNLDFWVLK
jgi:hypothetical protein